MSVLSQQEIVKVRKAAEESITLSNELKSSVVEANLRHLNASVKKLLAKKDAKIEIFVMKGKAD